MTDYLTALFQLVEMQAEEDPVFALAIHTAVLPSSIQTVFLEESVQASGLPAPVFSTQDTSSVESDLEMPLKISLRPELESLSNIPIYPEEEPLNVHPVDCAVTLGTQLMQASRQSAAISSPAPRHLSSSPLSPGQVHRIGTPPLPYALGQPEIRRLSLSSPQTHTSLLPDGPATASPVSWPENGRPNVERGVVQPDPLSFGTALSPEEVDRAFQRDSRRYDRGFALY